MTSVNPIRVVRLTHGILQACVTLGTVLSVMSLATQAQAQTSEELFFDPDNSFFPSPGGSGATTGGGGTWTVTKEFTSLDEITLGVGSVEIPAGSSATIQVDELITNNTGLDWTDFHLEVVPVDAPLDLLVQFNNVTAPPGFTTMTMDNALWVFGLVPPADDLLLVYEMEVSSANGGFALYAVHEHPSVPEPPTVALTLLCMAIGVGTGGWRCRRDRQRKGERRS